MLSQWFVAKAFSKAYYALRYRNDNTIQLNDLNLEYVFVSNENLPIEQRPQTPHVIELDSSNHTVTVYIDINSLISQVISFVDKFRHENFEKYYNLRHMYAYANMNKLKNTKVEKCGINIKWYDSKKQGGRYE